MKHKTILVMLYNCGLRLSELLHLKITDIHSDRHLLLVRDAKWQGQNPVEEIKELRALTNKLNYWATWDESFKPGNIRPIELANWEKDLVRDGTIHNNNACKQWSASV